MNEIQPCENCPRLQPLRKEVAFYESEVEHHQARYNRAVIEEAASIIQKEEWVATQSSEDSLEDIDPEWTVVDDLRKAVERGHEFLYRSSLDNQETSAEGLNYNADRLVEMNESISYFIERCPDKQPKVTKERFGLFGKPMLKCSSQVLPPVYGDLPNGAE